MAFKFNMQKVLDYRMQLEEEAQVKYGQAIREAALSREQLEKLKKELADAQEASFGKIMQSGERWLHDQYIKGLGSDVAQVDLQTRMLEQMAEEARKVLAARAIDRKMLEKLKEKQKKQYVKSEQKQEQNFNDEIATIRYQASSFQTN